MEIKDPLLKEQKELYAHDLWMFTATSGPDIQYSKGHIYSMSGEAPLCGLNSKYFEVIPDAVWEATKDHLVLKEETSTSVYMSFRKTQIPTDNICKRCLNKAIAILDANDPPPLTTPIQEKRLPLKQLPARPELPTPTKGKSQTKLTVPMLHDMKNTWQWAKHYYPDISEKAGKKLILGLLHYPINMELAMEELYQLYLEDGHVDLKPSGTPGKLG